MKTTKFRVGITLLTLAVSMFPQSLVAAGCSVTALDTVAGLGTEVQISACAGQSGGALQIDGPTGAPFQQNVMLDSSGNGSLSVAGKYTEVAGKYSATFGSTRTTFVVMADAPDDAHSSLTASARTLGPSERLTVTAILRDRYENPLSGRPIALLSNRTQDTITSRSSQTDEDGRFTWTVESQQDGMMTLTAYDVLSSRQLKSRLDIAVGDGVYAPVSQSPLTASMVGQGGDSGVTDHFKIKLSKEGSVNANELFSLTISAVDSTNQVVEGYAQKVFIETSDPDAEFPKKGQDRTKPNVGWVDFRPMDLGVRSVPLGFVFRAGGAQTIQVYDEKDPSVRGEITVQVNKVQTTGGGEIVILDPPDRTRIGARTVMVQGKAPSLINLKVKGGLKEVFGESDAEGVFRIQVELHPQDNEATLFVSSENEAYESDPVHVIVDQVPPKIDTITFDPPEGKVKDPATVTVLSEPGLKTIAAKLDDSPIVMTETQSGTYVGSIAEAPGEGQHDFTIDMTDDVGNKASMASKWNVKRKTLPIVEGVTAEGQANGVMIKWNAITGTPVTEYRIYIARDDDPQNFIASVETNSVVTSAVIKDLEIGYAYQFSITALNADGQESAEKSAPASAAPLGLLLTARADNEALVLEWNPPSSLPLANYILEYGTEPGVYTERRTLNASLRSFTIRDLLNDVTYEVRLTPIAVTGKVLADLTAITRGTPSGSAGFHPGAPDDIPSDLTTPPVPAYTVDPPIDDIPAVTDSGPGTSMAVATLILAALLGIIWRQHRSQKKMTRQFLEMMNQRYHS